MKIMSSISRPNADQPEDDEYDYDADQDGAHTNDDDGDEYGDDDAESEKIIMKTVTTGTNENHHVGGYD